jgi:hypothetical protein
VVVVVLGPWSNMDLRRWLLCAVRRLVAISCRCICSFRPGSVRLSANRIGWSVRLQRILVRPVSIDLRTTNPCVFTGQPSYVSFVSCQSSSFASRHCTQISHITTSHLELRSLANSIIRFVPNCCSSIQAVLPAYSIFPHQHTSYTSNDAVTDNISISSTHTTTDGTPDLVPKQLRL